MNRQELLAAAQNAWANHPRARSFVFGLVIGAVLSIGMVRCAGASPLYLVAGAGASEHGLTGNGIWYQEGFPYSANPHSWTAHIGAGYQIKSWLAVEALYHDFGHPSISADWVRDDDNYSAAAANHCNGACNPLNHGDGSATARGVSLSLLPQHRFSGGITTYARAGVIFYRTHWNEQWMCCLTEPSKKFPQESLHTWQGDGPGNAQPDSSGRTSLLGIGMRFGNFGLEYMRTGKFSAAGGSGFNRVDTLTASYRIFI